MVPMAIGLIADAGLAAYQAGNIRRSLALLSDALEALPSIDPVQTLRAGFCHRAVHAAVLWTRARIMRQDIRVDGQPITMEPGQCSHPEPPAETPNYQLIDHDTSWYYLAMAEAASGVDLSIAASIGDRLTKGAIPSVEKDFRLTAMQYAIDRLDAVGFCTHFMRYVECMDYISRSGSSLKETIDPSRPHRAKIPRLDSGGPFDPHAEHVAADAILAYGIRGAMENRADIVADLAQAMTSRVGRSFPGKLMLDHWNEGSVLSRELDQIAMNAINSLRTKYPQSEVFWIAGMSFLLWIRESHFGNMLMARLAAWQRDVWKRIAAAESFKFMNPWKTLPDVERALSLRLDDERFVASILLSISPAIGLPITRHNQDILKAIAEEPESPAQE